MEKTQLFVNGKPIEPVVTVRDGYTFTPEVDDAGNLSWSNDGDLPNPSTINIKGRDGIAGRDGIDGVAPHIDPTSGNWFLGIINTGFKARGETGENGISPHIDSITGNWFVGEDDTGVKASGGGSGTVRSVCNILSDSTGNVPLTASNLDTYDKYQIDDKIGNVLNIQYLSPPLNTPVVKSGKEIFSKIEYPIADKSFVIYEDNTTIKFIRTVENTSNNTIYIRTLNKDTHEFTDVDTGNSYSIVTNQVGYALLFADETYCYFSNTGSTSDGTIPVNFYRLNYKISASIMEVRANFPKAWCGTSFIKVNSVAYAFGGGSSWSATTNWDSVWKYDITNDVWTVLSTKLPQLNFTPQLIYSELDNRIYSTFGYYTNSDSTWSQKFAWYFDIASEIVLAIPDRLVSAMNGVYCRIDIGCLAIPLVYRAGASYKWGELGSQIYIPDINQWVDINVGLPFKSGFSYNNTNDVSDVKIVDIEGNTVHLTLDGISYYLNFYFALLGLYSKNETVYITSYTKADKDVHDSNGNIILAGKPINPSTEIKILEDDTRLYLMTSITTDGSWIRRPPTKILGMAEETILWEGSVGSDSSPVTNTINLVNPISDYDKLGIYFYSIYAESTTRSYDYKEFPCDEIIPLLGQTTSVFSCIFGYQNQPGFTCIMLNSSTYDKFTVSQHYSYITKIVGLKYKTL